MNYLKPDIKRGNITPDEDDLIIRLHSLLGNRWSLIAGRLPGRTDNEIKNYWNTHLSKRLLSEGTDPETHRRLSDPVRELRKRKRSSRRRNVKGESVTRSAARAVAGSDQRPRIYLPRPTRVTSRVRIPWNESFESNAESGPQSLAEEQGFGADGVGGLSWSDFKVAYDDDDGIDFFVGGGGGGEVKVNQLDGSELACRSPVSMGEATLEKLYEEYLQLLNAEEDHQDHELDSIAESLLA